jgi:hypothetical protein
VWHILLDVASINTEEILILFLSFCNIHLKRLGLDESVICFAICLTAVKFSYWLPYIFLASYGRVGCSASQVGLQRFRLLTELTKLQPKKHIMNKAYSGARHVVCCCCCRRRRHRHHHHHHHHHHFRHCC